MLIIVSAAIATLIMVLTVAVSEASLMLAISAPVISSVVAFGVALAMMTMTERDRARAFIDEQNLA